MIEGIDVSDSDSGTKLVEAVKKQLGEGGTLDYVLCNAGWVQFLFLSLVERSFLFDACTEGNGVPCR